MSFASDYFKVIRGTAGAQLIGLAFLPVFMRLFEPSDLGQLQGLQSILSILLVAASLRLEIGVMNAADGELGDYTLVCFWLCVAVSVVVGAIVASLFAFHIEIPAVTKIGNLLALCPAILFAAGLGQLLSYLALREKQFNATALSKVSQSISYGTGAIALSPTGFGALSLGLADLIGRVVAAFVLFKATHLRWRKLLPARLSQAWQVVWTSSSYNRSLTYIALPGAIINVAGGAYSGFALLAIFTPADAGQYGLVERMIGTPLGLIVAAGSQVFVANFAEVRRKGEDARAVFRSVVLRHAVLALAVAIPFYWVAPLFFSIVFGPKWAMAGELARALAPLYVISLVAGPVNMALTLAGHRKLQFAWDAGRLLAVIVIWAVIRRVEIDPVTAVGIYSGISTGLYALNLLATYWALSGSAARTAASAP